MKYRSIRLNSWIDIVGFTLNVANGIERFRFHATAIQRFSEVVNKLVEVESFEIQKRGET